MKAEEWYDATIKAAHIKTVGDNLPVCNIQVSLQDETNTSQLLWGTVWLHDKMIATGKNAGRSNFEVGMETLIALGLRGGADNLSSLVGAPCRVAVKWNEKGKKWEVGFFSAPGQGKSQIDPDFLAKFNAILGTKAPAQSKPKFFGG